VCDIICWIINLSLSALLNAARTSQALTLMISQLLFWLSLGILVYVFFGFVLLLFVVSLFRRKTVREQDLYPSVSVIICAYNEEKHIEGKIFNCLDLDYPTDRIEIVVVSDGSTDNTDRLLATTENREVKTYRAPTQQGKTACQNIAVGMAKNDILFFTDATVRHPPNALKLLLRHLSESTVGCVTGKPVFNRDQGAASMGQTIREKYELHLRNKLGETTSLFGAQDCIYVIPRKLYTPINADLDSGFVAPLKLLESGYRTVYEPRALAFVDRPPPNIRDEFVRRSRIALRGMRGLIYMRQLMNPFRYGFVAISLISTRLLRWLSPVFLIILFLSNLFLLDTAFYCSSFIVQVGFYLTAFIAYLFAQKGHKLGLPFYIPLYFCLMVCSASVGLKRLLSGESGQMWQTRR
jgi:cellulose synthase/poly-beta-1,6-N-acetylglucosamine synthase-like glycosyltransferase